MPKYDDRAGINHIDYKNYMPSKMLSDEYLDEFMNIMTSMSINLR